MRPLQRVLARVGIRTPFARDALLAGVLAVLGLSTLGVGAFTMGPAEPEAAFRTPLAVVGVLGSTVPLAWRRQAPVAVLAVVLVGYTAQLLGITGAQGFNAGPFVALYSLGAYAERRRVYIATPVAVVLLVTAELGLLAEDTIGMVTVEGPGETVLYAMFFVGGVIYGAAALLGAYVQTRRAYREELVARAERLEREREERAERAVADERARLARELHDVVAHHLSGIVVQAGAAERLVERDPAKVQAMLADIRDSGKATLTSMRRLVGILRAGDDTDGTAPQPGLERLDVVADQARAAGIKVELTVEGEPVALPSEVDLAAYRVLQEALTNVRKHAPGATANAVVRYRPRVVEVEVVDDGGHGGAIEDEPSDGVGLVGMRERVLLLDGTFGAGPNTRGGWTVRAQIPTDGEAPR